MVKSKRKKLELPYTDFKVTVISMLAKIYDKMENITRK